MHTEQSELLHTSLSSSSSSLHVSIFPIIPPIVSLSLSLTCSHTPEHSLKFKSHHSLLPLFSFSLHFSLLSSPLLSFQVIKKPGGSLADSFLEEGFVLNKSFGVGQPRRCDVIIILLLHRLFIYFFFVLLRLILSCLILFRLVLWCLVLCCFISFKLHPFLLVLHSRHCES